MKKLTKGC